MTANELHRQIAEFVEERFSESGSRSRAHSASQPPDDCGPTFTRDLLARTSLARSSRSESEQATADRALTHGDHDAVDAVRESAAREAPPRQVKGAMRIVLDVVSPAGLIVAGIVLLLGIGWIGGDGQSDRAEVAIREADDAVPVDVKTSQPQNLFNEAMRTFALVASGQLGVQVPGKVIRDVEKYFVDNGIAYTVRFPITSLPLTGGIVSRYGDRAFAQLVYSKGTEAVYVIEVPVEELRSGKRLYITEDVLARLDRGEKFQEMTPEGESLIMMRDGNLVVTAVGNMEPEQLARIVRPS